MHAHTHTHKRGLEEEAYSHKSNSTSLLKNKTMDADLKLGFNCKLLIFSSQTLKYLKYFHGLVEMHSQENIKP